MPNLQDLATFISSVGFPIAACIYFMYANMKAGQRHDALVEKISCVEQQVLESKLQVGQVIHQIPKTEEGIQK